MEDTYKLKAIVLSRKNHSEHDSRVVVYSPELGKLELTVRGAKKIKSKLAGHLEPLNLVDIMAVRGQRHDYVGTAVCQNCFGQIKGDLDKLAPAGKVLKITDQLIKPGVAQPEIFQLLNDFFTWLEAAKKESALLTNFFILKLLSCLGQQPELSFCVSCVNKIKPGRNRFDLARGGLVCPKCVDLKDAGQLAISDDGIKLLRLALKADFRQLGQVRIDKKLHREVGEIIDKFFKYSF